MKTRVISALVGLVILFSVIMVYDTIWLNIALSVISIIAVDELLSTSGIIRFIPLSALCFFLGGIIPFYDFFNIQAYLPLILYLSVLLTMMILLKVHGQTKIELLTFMLLLTILVSISLTLFIAMRDEFGVTIGLFGATLTCISAWVSDTGAYFAGYFFGKHKLAPTLSPKKTIEGFIGGTIAGVLGVLGGAWIYANLICPHMGWAIEVNYMTLALVAPIMSMTGVVGDLSASAIKRQFEIKDFGKIMPGHGGILDRFDSVLLINPMSYFVLVYFIPVVLK